MKKIVIVLVALCFGIAACVTPESKKCGEGFKEECPTRHFGKEGM